MRRARRLKDAPSFEFPSGRKLVLLEKIQELGSITKAAKAASLSYKAAWDAVDDINNASEAEVVASKTGGAGGGGARLTEHGQAVLRVLRSIETEHRGLVASLRRGIDDFGRYYSLFRRLSMQTSARNQYFGKVSRVRRGKVNSEVELALKGPERIVATITNESLDDLGLKVGSEAFALIKASWIILYEGGTGIKLSARNQFLGEVVKVVPGAVNSEVKIRLRGGSLLSAVVTRESVKAMGLKPGVSVGAAFKAPSVILGVSR
jgi:molybdate transport system regulatory protein